ncbi:hypothetical protein [Dulcicalothrix desertica]|uniref:hypothetical protein n=1 Tax=Dulcicalothrix desertica TaxID=32056 RepID=UPI000F8C337B|nr:hypothetical protein [Dulcicalothrix desertica]
MHNRSKPPVFDPNILRLKVEGTGVSKTIEFTQNKEFIKLLSQAGCGKTAPSQVLDLTLLIK